MHGKMQTFVSMLKPLIACLPACIACITYLPTLAFMQTTKFKLWSFMKLQSSVEATKFCFSVPCCTELFVSNKSFGSLPIKIMFGDFCPFRRQWESVLFAHANPRNGPRSHIRVATLFSYTEKLFKQKICYHQTLFCALYCYDHLINLRNL